MKMIYPCKCTSYNGGQCYNCLNGAHHLCEGKPKCRVKTKGVGLKLVCNAVAGAAQKQAIKWNGKDMNRWIAVNVMGWTDDVDGSGSYFNGKVRIDSHKWQPMTCAADAFAVLDVCVKIRMANVEMSYWPQFGRRKYSVGGCAGVTLQEAICRFARAMFSKKL